MADASGLVTQPRASTSANVPVVPHDATALSGVLDKHSASKLGLGVIDNILDVPASGEFLERVPIGFARKFCLLGLSDDARDIAGGHASPDRRIPHAELVVAIGGLSSWEQLETVARFVGRPVRPVFAPPEKILAAINGAYQNRTGQAQVIIESLDRKTVLSELQQLTLTSGGGAGSGGGAEDLLDVASRAPVIRLVNVMLFEAVKQTASDIHIQPYEDRLVVRMRIDGVLFDAFELPKALQSEVVSRVKVMARMNIAEKRLAQDGRSTVQVGDRLIDLRIASLPTSFGERLVIRLLDKSARLYTLPELGMGSITLASFRETINVEHGLILVTGPTGSGKSTTLYAALQELNGKELNILTLEDPIEYQLPGVSQTQVSDKKGMTFASGLRHVLRQDPDIIMVGEIRDHETAVMAIQSALTGHLVFSTLHTNDAASAVTRLLDLGIEPYLAASSLVAVLAQRLVRRVCPACGAPLQQPPPLDSLAKLGLSAQELALFDPRKLRTGTGCDACRHTGYRGRVGIFELMPVNDAIRCKIQVSATAADIKRVAIEQGMSSLSHEGAIKIREGISTVEEILRVTMRQHDPPPPEALTPPPEVASSGASPAQSNHKELSPPQSLP